MRNRFKLNEEEKNRIRGLHGISVITEQDDASFEVVNAVDDEEGVVTADTQGEPEVEEIVDDEITAEEIVDVPEDEDSWLEERWEDLSEVVRNIFRRSKAFAACKPSVTSCPAFNEVSRRRKKRILRGISLSWPKIKWPKFVLRFPKIRFRKNPFKGAGKHH